MKRDRITGGIVLALVLSALVIAVPFGLRIHAKSAPKVGAYATQAPVRAEIATAAFRWFYIVIVAGLAGFVGVALVVAAAFASRAWRIARNATAIHELPSVALLNGSTIVDTRGAQPVTLRLRDTEALPALERAEGSQMVKDSHIGGER